MTAKYSKKSMFVPLVIILSLVGLFFIAISTLNEAQSIVGDKFYFIKRQSVWLLTGGVLFFLASKISLVLLQKSSKVIYFISLLFLAATIIPGLNKTTLGASRWISVGLLGFQPSEFYKLSCIIYFSSLFSQPNKCDIKHLALNLTPGIFLIILEPNFSTAALIFLTVISIFYLAGGKIVHTLTVVAVCLTIGILLVLLTPYRHERLMSLINLHRGETTSYHAKQNLQAISSGGVFGKGIANSDQKYRYIPKVASDSILAVIGEETGFVGMVSIIITYLYLTGFMFTTGRLATNDFSRLIALGIGVLFSSQAGLNISATVGLAPLTGVTLPLVSYGGSSMIIILFSLGLVHNIHNQSRLIYSSEHASTKKYSHHRKPSHPSS